MFKRPHDCLCDFARRDAVAGSVGRRNDNCAMSSFARGDERVQVVLCLAVQHLFDQFVQDGSPGRAAGDRRGWMFDCFLDDFGRQKMGWRSASAGAAASLAAGLDAISILRWARRCPPASSAKISARLLVLRRSGRRRHGFAERLGIDAAAARPDQNRRSWHRRPSLSGARVARQDEEIARPRGGDIPEPDPFAASSSAFQSFISA